MKKVALSVSKGFLRSLSVAVAFSLVATAFVSSTAYADQENSAFSRLKRSKEGLLTPGSSSSPTAGHSSGSGQPATTQTKILNDGSVAPFVTPDSPQSMQAMVDKYSQIVADGGWPQVPRGKLKKGSEGKAVAALNKRLYMEGYLRVEATEGEFAQVFTSATEDALKRFQYNHGLAVTGTIDGSTLAALNVSAASRLATIKANLPRLAEYSKDLGDRYVIVNIPAQQIETVSAGTVYSLHNAIVGRPSRPTPVVMTPLTTLRFNPYWNAPASIVEKDILPRMLSKGPSKIMAEMNMKVFDGVGGPEVDPDKINWRKVRVDDYHFRQEPGGSNAMATAKIEFNSPFGIYLHDTPEPHLFNTGSRFYSSGCVRVDQVSVFIDWVLQGQDGIDAARIANLAETKERLDVEIVNPPQLRVAYLTAWPAKDGVAAFRPDIYELDGTGFILGQPLPVGETLDGKRYVLKPIPRLQEDIDTDDGFGFASLFRGSAKGDVLMPGQNRANGDSLLDLSSMEAKKQAELKKKKKKEEAEKKKAAEKAKLAAKKKADEKAKLAAKKKADEKAKLAAKKKADEKAKVAAEKKAAEKKTKVASADTDAAAKKGKSSASKTASSSANKTASKATAAKKPPADCKPGSDGKLPEGCPASAEAKKPSTAATAEKTATAN
jgi:peptidoglycan hydrolase-like protein with peptidoglycan-binding domain